MKKNIIILTKSIKHGDFCVAGIDTDNGEWIEKATLLQSIPVSLKENIKNFFEKTSHFNVLTIFNII